MMFSSRVRISCSCVQTKKKKTDPILVQGASLNYRDLIIPKGGYPFPLKDSVIPGSDGAGTVEAVGKSVTRFKAGGMYRFAYTSTGSLLTHSQTRSSLSSTKAILPDRSMPPPSLLVSVVPLTEHCATTVSSTSRVS